jgi:hypothetical protein
MYNSVQRDAADAQRDDDKEKSKKIINKKKDLAVRKNCFPPRRGNA